MNVIETIQELMNTNQKGVDLTNELLIHIYQSATTPEKEIINKIIVCLCGVQFDTLLKSSAVT